MNLKNQQFTAEIGGKTVTLEVSKLAEQANAAVLGRCGDTSVLVTVVIGKNNREIDYFPLTVDYEERFYAAGKIIGSRFVRREGRPSEAAILSGRMIDRTIRPFFDQRLRRDVQIVITVLSYDEENDPDFIALLSASTALAISDIPWNGPVAGVRIGKLKGENNALINPVNSALRGENFSFDAFVSGNENKINMIEFGGDQVGEEDVINGFEEAHREIKKIVEFQKNIVKNIGRKKIETLLIEPDLELKKKIQEFLKDKLEAAIYVGSKPEQRAGLEELKNKLTEHLTAGGQENLKGIDALFEEEVDAVVHKNVLESEKRPDGRKLDEIRPLHAETGLFNRLHGSALFIRGGTQALGVVTLAPPGAEQLIETMEISYKRRFMLHYNFPPYSTGEIGRLGGAGRREIGHGALAEKAVRSIIPSQEEFPYTIRVVSEILASNGSSSMATVCASSMALMDAGVPIKKAVAGIAMGLMSDRTDRTDRTDKSDESDESYKILTDIQGPEDHYGDMDCKVAGTTDGVTAMQMDVKVEGVTIAILKEVLSQAKKARLEILDFIGKTIAAPRPQVSSYAPVVLVAKINPEQIGEVIGPGGKMINAIIARTGVITIDIEQTGKVFVAAAEAEKANAALAEIKAITREFLPGEIIEGEVIKILDFGAIVDLGGGRDGMIHVSELKSGYVEKVEDVIKIGDKVRAKIIRAENGRVALSLRGL
ncbi:polyribonucleotide nucleotidyltransferase [Candidatus Wolfebacteria bacterium]|nr:polyribonucleotide nucleotidyltransferase [Candidatus Wolfebacteria bacterium]